MDDDAVGQITERWRAIRPDLDPDPMLVIGRISRLAGSIDALLRPPFAAAKLGNGDFDVLAALRRADDAHTLTPGELSRAMLVTTGAVTKRVDRLERRGLVVRAIAEGDARGRRISLTRDGAELVDRLMEEHLDRQRALLDGLTPSQREQLAGLLGRLSLAVEQLDA